MLLYDSLKQDALFVTDVVESTLKCCQQQQLQAVRVRASWTLGRPTQARTAVVY